MEMYPPKSLEQKYYLGVILNLLFFFDPPELSDNLDGPDENEFRLMSSHLTANTTTTTTTTTSNTTTNKTTNSTNKPSIPAVKKGWNLIFTPIGFFEFIAGFIMGTGLVP
jgi:hypothetical protein